ncbi:hypothetical protein ACQ4LF_06940 [Aeromonas salmonicida]
MYSRLKAGQLSEENGLGACHFALDALELINKVSADTPTLVDISLL